MSKPLVVIAVPLRRYRTIEDLPLHLRELVDALRSDRTLPWDFEFAACVGGNVSRGRNKLVAAFLRGPGKWLLFIDDDIVATKEQVVALLERRLGVCGAMYVRREAKACWVLNPYREAEIQSDGLLAVPEIGTGLKCYHRSVFELLIKKEPELEYVADDTGSQEWGFFCQGMMTVDGRRRWLPEDYWLDQVCRRNGIPVFADTTIKVLHRDTDGTDYPLNGEWPPMPSPIAKPRAIPPPMVSELKGRDYKPGKLIIALQYWKDDQSAAMRLARFIADLEPTRREDTEICFVRRFDCLDSDEAITTMRHVAEKFVVTRQTTPIHVPGYPRSPNVMATAVLKRAGSWLDCSGVLLMEADCIPVQRDWLNQLHLEWARARAGGKLLMGSWREAGHELGHLNGNMVVSPKLWNALELDKYPVANDSPWDLHYAAPFSKVWARTGLISNRYREICVTAEKIQTPECGDRPPILTHGVKDSSVWDYVKQFGLTT